MRWGNHLLFAFIAGALSVVIVLLYIGDPTVQPINDFFAGYGINATLVLAILVIVDIAIWAMTSKG